MGIEFLLFFSLLLATAAVLRGDFAFSLLYLFGGVVLLGWFWNRSNIRRIRIKRHFEAHAFLGEEVPVRLKIRNSSYLPVIWLHVQESIPIQLGHRRAVKQVISLNPRGQVEINYQLRGTKRGLYPIGPLLASSGDVLGLTGEATFQADSEMLTVYPKIIRLTRVDLPSRSPLGTLRHTQPIFEDPSRVLSKRDYVAGDSLRRVDWKATAASGRLQVKQYEPSIALETVLVLNLNSEEYPTQQRIDATELGIVIAASLANWVVARRQSVGLITNGHDPAGSEEHPAPIPPRKGRAHLMRILEALARVRLAEHLAFADLVRRQGSHLPWGTTLILITGQADEALFEAIFQCQRRGQQVVLILAGRGTNLQESQRRAKYFGIPLYAFLAEADLDRWRQ